MSASRGKFSANGDNKPPPAGFSRPCSGDFSGAFADLGTFLPLVVGMFAVAELDPAGVLVGFGLFALATGLLYGRPIPVQPMKAVAAVVVASGLNAAAVAASGLLIGMVLCALAVFNTIGRLGRLIPDTVLAGIQLGVGLILGWAGLKLIAEAPDIGLVALAVLLGLQFTRFKPLAALLVVMGATIYGLSQPGTGLPDLAWGIHLPTLRLPTADAWWTAGADVLLPQLALTLTNATLITAAIAARYFPEDQQKITPDRLAMSTGVLNLVLAPFGAFPMCHGAGGLVVQHRFGARTGWAPLLFGISCLGLGLLLGPGAVTLLAVIPLAAVGGLLLVAGADLALAARFSRLRGAQFLVMVTVSLACVVFNVAVGLLTGLILEGLRKRFHEDVR